MTSDPKKSDMHSLTQCRHSFTPAAKALQAVLLAGLAALCTFTAKAFVQEGELEFIATGDFNGDGKLDIAIVDRFSGRVRLGYQLSPGSFDWANWQPGGLKNPTGVSVARLVDAKRDSLALTSADANLVTVVDAPNANIESDLIHVPNTALGPNTVVALDVGGPGNSPLPDLYVSSIYNNDPTPNLVTLYRNQGRAFTKIADLPAPGAEARGDRVALKPGGHEFVAVVSSGDTGNSLRVLKLDSGKPEEVLSVGNLPAGAAYVTGQFGKSPMPAFLFYSPAEQAISLRTVSEANGRFRSAEAKTFTLDRPVRQMIAVDGRRQTRLLALFGEQEPAELMDFDGANPPVTAQKLPGVTNKLLSAAVALPDAIVLFSSITNNRPASHYQVYTIEGGKFVAGAYGSLASLADRDDSTVPDIHKRIVSLLTEKSEADMTSYTNTIPGTEVSYSMVAIPGGEFTMGTPEDEKDRKPDEGPPHKVKVSPFWIGQFEVTWNQFLLFMYPDDERKLREALATEESVNAVSDAVTRPSKPYVDMSFGMGKDGFPAISMTQHGANKFCHWLGAKTGHFYRLPTEAEWEYACRAGTTTAYSFGDDPAKLADYGWFFDNSDSRYQKIGRKKPNPWGLYDMHGNVTEWVLDQLDGEFYKASAAKGTVVDPWNKAAKPYPHAARGGSWDDDPPALRSGARRGSSRAWKQQDPQLPKSIWYLTDAQFIGFRLVRPLKVPPPEEMVKYWTSGVEKD